MSRKTHTWRHRWAFNKPPTMITTSCGRKLSSRWLADQELGRGQGTCATCARADAARHWRALNGMLFWEAAVPGYLAKDLEWFKHIWGIERSSWFDLFIERARADEKLKEMALRGGE